MWLFDFMGVVAVVLFATVIVLLAASFMRVGAAEPEGKRPRRKWIVWPVTIIAALALGYCQRGGYYYFTDPAGSDWALVVRGWPLSYFEAVASPTVRPDTSETAILVLSAVFDVLISIGLVSVLFALTQRFQGGGPRRSRRQLAWRLAMAATAVAVVLLLDRSFSSPRSLPGTESVMFYTSLVYEMWYVRAVILIVLIAGCYVLGGLIWRAISYLFALRAEGVL